MVIGLGSGSTATWAIRFLGERVRAGLAIRGVPTSSRSAQLAREEGIPLLTLADVSQLDLTLDGADEVDPALQLIKGGGGALLREKVVASASRRVIILADSSKEVRVLGLFPLPVAVAPFAAPLVARLVAGLARDRETKVQLRMDARMQPFVTDDGLHILDCHFGQIPDPRGLASELASMPGVAEHGLFLDLADVVMIAGKDGITERRSKMHREGRPV